MKMSEAIEKREELLAEQRKINQAIKILKSESIPHNYGIEYAETLYNERLAEIDREIKRIAREAEPDPGKVDCNKYTVEFDFEGTRAYPTVAGCVMIPSLDPDKVLKFDDEEQAKCFASFYAYKHGWKVVKISDMVK